jgi:secreted trypsin-like serine protease
MVKTLSCLFVVSSSAVAGGLTDPVVGGTPVSPGEYPDVVLVVAPDALCTGTLVTPDVVLTAGHCIDTHPALVLVGSVDYQAPGGEAIRVKSAIAYPDWQHHYDVGVLVLDHAASAAPRAIASACTVKQHLAAGMPVQVVGFGLTSRSGTGQNSRLHEASLPVIDATCAGDPWCQSTIAPGGEFTAGGRGTDSCFGDSGGPLYVSTNDGPALVGVVSRGVEIGGEPCAGGGVYERADKVVPWIEKVTGEKVVRATCDSKADDPGAAAAGGGCSVGPGAFGGAALVFAGMVWLLTIPRRRQG